MKKNNTKRNGNGHTVRSIRIEFANPSASAVAIAGTFNNWSPDSTYMVRLGDGRWAKDLALAPGKYEYRLIVDGNWMTDPCAHETTPNPFGEWNSVLKVNAAQE